MTTSVGRRWSPPGREALAAWVWLAFFGFLLHGDWEWLQTPFYDDGGVSLNTVVWYRFHCTLVDVLILLGSAALVGFALRRPAWLLRPEPRHLVATALLGVAYTAASEQLNVAIRQSWAYSRLMPVVPGTYIGVVPLVQWLVIPPLAVWLAARVAHRP